MPFCAAPHTMQLKEQTPAVHVQRLMERTARRATLIGNVNDLPNQPNGSNEMHVHSPSQQDRCVRACVCARVCAGVLTVHHSQCHSCTCSRCVRMRFRHTDSGQHITSTCSVLPSSDHLFSFPQSRVAVHDTEQSS